MIDMTVAVPKQEIDLGNFLDGDEGKPAKSSKPRVTVAQFNEFHAAKQDNKCPKCANSPKAGFWWSRKYKTWGTCGRCGGTGVVTEVDKSRFKAYTERKESGAEMETTHITHIEDILAANRAF